VSKGYCAIGVRGEYEVNYSLNLNFVPLIAWAADVAPSFQKLKVLDELKENEDYVTYIAEANRLLKNEKLNQDGFFNVSIGKSIVLGNLNQTEEAYKSLNNLKAFAQENPYYQSRILGAEAGIKLIEGKKKEAYTLFKEAIDKNRKGNKGFHIDCLAKAASLEDGKKFDESVEEIRNLAKNNLESRLDAYLSLSLIYYEKGRYKDALGFINIGLSQSLKKNKKKYFEMLELKGDILTKVGKPHDSKEAYKKIIKLKPKSPLQRKIFAWQMLK